MSYPYAPLFTPLTLGKTLTIQNRFCAGPLTLPSLHGPFGEFSPDGLAYFEARAKGGFGLIYTGAFHPDTLVDPVHPLDSKQPLKAPKTFQRTAVELLERLDTYGAQMLPQVSMGYGRNAMGAYGPSEIPYYHDPSKTTPALTKDQIKQKIDQMVATAAFLKTCGFRGIEVHAMHWGYLLDQFAMSFMNHRTDEYGGELENRLRCAREIVEGVKAVCGPDFVVSMRLALKTYIQDYPGRRTCHLPPPGSLRLRLPQRGLWTVRFLLLRRAPLLHGKGPHPGLGGPGQAGSRHPHPLRGTDERSPPGG